MEWLETLSKYVGWVAGIATGLATIAGVGVKLWQFWSPSPPEPKPMQAILVDGRVEGAQAKWPAWAWVLGVVLLLWLAFGSLMAASVAFVPRPPEPPPEFTLVGRWSTTDRGPSGEPVQVTFRADGMMEINGQVKGAYAYRGGALQFYDGYGNLIEQGRVVWASANQLSFQVTQSVFPQRNGGTVLYTR